MTKQKRFFYNGIVLSLVGFAMRAVALLLGAYISGAIGAEGVGLQGLIATVYAFAVTFATSGASLSVTRLVAASIGEGDGGERILRAAFLYAAIFGTLATLAHMTPNHFCRTFRRYTGQTPFAYITGFRLRKAQYALRTTDMSVTEIALYAGFGDVSHFIRVFRETYGHTPKVYRSLEVHDF